MANEAEQHIQTALVDGLLVKSALTKQRGKQKSTVYTFPQWQTFVFSENQPDKCCFECHMTGELLKCDGCVRSFHAHCVKSLEEKQLELEQFVSKQKRIPTSAFNPRVSSIRHNTSASPETLTEESNVSSARDTSPTNGTHAEDSLPEMIAVGFDCVPQPGELYVNQQQVKHESTSEEYPVGEDVKLELDVKEGIVSDEAMFVCMIRPPDRRREKSNNTPTVKPEESANTVDDTIAQVRDDAVLNRYCYVCRLLKDSTNNAPPDVGQHELNYLLNFIIKQYKSWVPEDTYSTSKLGKGKPPQSLTLESKTIEVCKKMLLRTPKTIAFIRKKIEEDQYQTLEEFHVDLLDIAHNVAIIHGASSFDYSAVMYLVADCVYDLSEIRRCPDCFRHSNEKAEAGWFARPCRTRHELVYAKQKSYQYWPAKVIRVLNNKYDVRFFGDKHLRALIDASCVKPIDTDVRELRVNTKQRGFQLAMDEMLKHQSLIDGSRDHYAFGVESEPAALNTPIGGINLSIAQLHLPADLKALFQQASDAKELKEIALKILQDNEERYNRRFDWLNKKHNQEISDIKKKLWCRVCEKEARMRCCWNMYYCSRDCQTQHWPVHQNEHQQEIEQNKLPALTTSNIEQEYI
uniref:MYND-type domain-containing protein n=1 Tax=Anopheles farauti TaxID=69004 RepID=A0A182Q901_9DIPT